MMKKYAFDVYYPGERDAGIIGYTDTIAIDVDSGDPGGETGEFEAFMASCLSEWFDGARVSIKLNDESTRKE